MNFQYRYRNLTSTVEYLVVHSGVTIKSPTYVLVCTKHSTIYLVVINKWHQLHFKIHSAARRTKLRLLCRNKCGKPLSHHSSRSITNSSRLNRLELSLASLSAFSNRFALALFSFTMFLFDFSFAAFASTILASSEVSGLPLAS